MENLLKEVNKKSLLISLLIVSLFTIFIFNNTGFIEQETSQDYSEIKKVVQMSLEEANLIVFPTPYNEKAMEKVPEAVKQNIREKILSKVEQIYTSPLLEHQTQALLDAIDGQIKTYERAQIIKTNFETIDIQIFGNKATVNTKVGYDNNTRFGNFDFYLIKEDNAWKIYKFDILDLEV